MQIISMPTDYDATLTWYILINNDDNYLLDLRHVDNHSIKNSAAFFNVIFHMFYYVISCTFIILSLITFSHLLSDQELELAHEGFFP